MKTLKAQNRDVSASLEPLRAEGLVPAIIYGKGIENIAISVKENEVRSLWRDVRDTEPFTLSYNEKPYTVTMHDMQVHVVSGDILHIDFLIQK